MALVKWREHEWWGEEDKDTGRKVKKKFSSREKPGSFKPGGSESIAWRSQLLKIREFKEENSAP